MAMYSFSLESFNAVACRSKAGQDDIWLIVNVTVGTRAAVAAWPIGVGVQAGQGFVGPWTAGPYQALAGETGAATYTIVNLSGSSPQDQEQLIADLSAGIAAALARAGGAAAAMEAAIRGLFGGAGELLTALAVNAGETDCRGLIGVSVAPFTVASAPPDDVVETTQPVTLSGTSPATCGTTPQSTAVFSVLRAPSLFGQSTPITVLPSAPAVMEMFAVGMDGLVRYNVRSGQGGFGAWQVVGRRTFSQSSRLVAVTGTAQRKDVFGTGTNGVIYRMSWTQAAGWSDWTSVSTLGQFLPGTPVSAISLGGFLSLFAVDPDGVAQSMTWNGDAVRDQWGPLTNPSTPAIVFGRGTPLLVISHIDTWVEVFGVSLRGQEYHTSRATNVSAWGPWEQLGATPAIVEPASRRYLGLNFNAKRLPDGSMDLGMTWFRVDGAGSVNQLAWTGDAGWIGRKVIPGLSTSLGGSVSGVRLGNQLLLYMVDGRTGQIGITSWTSPFPFFNQAWSTWTLMPANPALAKEREITAISTDDSHVELFVVDRQGVLQHVTEDLSPGWGTWTPV